MPDVLYESPPSTSPPTSRLAADASAPTGESAARRLAHALSASATLDAVHHRRLDEAAPLAPLAARRSQRLASQRPSARAAAHETLTKGSRLVTNFLRAAEATCMRGAPSSTLGVYPRRHPYAADNQQWGLNCSCLLKPAPFFWDESGLTDDAARSKLWTRGRVPTESCRCVHCK